MKTAAKLRYAALERFAAQGYAATTLKEIASDCGIKKPSIYAHFTSKEHLFKHLVQTSVYGEMDFVRDRLQRPLPATEALRGLLESIPSRFRQSAALRFWIQALYVPPPALAPEIRTYAGMFYSGLHSVIAGTLENGFRDGAARNEKREMMATAYLGILKGLYGGLLQKQGEESEKTAEALWAIYRRAMEL